MQGDTSVASLVEERKGFFVVCGGLGILSEGTEDWKCKESRVESFSDTGFDVFVDRTKARGG